MPVLGQSDLDGSPIDTIVIWTGLIANIPSGWVICDGNLGTPDLRDRFIKEVEDEFSSPGLTDGTTEETLTLAQIQAHAHVSTSTNSTHRHEIEVSAGTSGSSLIYKGGDTGVPETVPDASFEKTADPIQFQGGDQSHTNMPSFFEVIFIQRLT